MIPALHDSKALYATVSSAITEEKRLALQQHRQRLGHRKKQEESHW